MKKIIYLLGFILLGIIISCDRETNYNSTNLSEFTGQWEVTAYSDDYAIYGPFKDHPSKRSRRK